MHLHKEQQLHICIPSLIAGVFIGMWGVSPWSKRYADCPPTWLSWEQMSHDQKWDKLWMREDWLSGGSQSPSPFIWHGYLGNKAARQEAGERCKPLFVWITAKKPPGLQASCAVLGRAVRVGILVYCGARSDWYPSTSCFFLHIPAGWRHNNQLHKLFSLVGGYIWASHLLPNISVLLYFPLHNPCWHPQ